MINRTTERKLYFPCFNGIEARGRFRMWWVVVLLFVISLNGYAQPPVDELYTVDNNTGLWSDDATWVDGSSPGATGLNDNVNVEGYVTRFGDLDFNNGNLVVYDTLVINGNLTMGNNAELFVEAGGILIIYGDVLTGNMVEISNGGNIVVTGSWTMDGADIMGSFDNDGDLYIFDQDGSDLKDGDGYDDINCPDCVQDSLDLMDSGLGDFFLGGSYTIEASGPTTFCAGGAVTLSTTDSATNYQWYKDGIAITGASAFSYVATTTGDFDVEFDITYNGVTNSYAPVAVTVTVNALPVADILGVDPAGYCEGSFADTLTGDPLGGDFLAGTGMTIMGQDSAVFDPAVAGSYEISYTYTDGNGCTDTASASTIVYPLPDISIIGTDTFYCIGEPADTIIGFPAGGAFVYSAGFSSLAADSVVFDPSAEGSFDLRYKYSDVNGCTDSVDITIVVNPLPVLSVSGLLPDYCSNSLVDTLEGNLAPDGLFFGDEINDLVNGTAEFIIGTPGIKNVYYTAADINGCIDTVLLQTEVHDIPSVSFSGLDSLYDVSYPAATLTGSPSGGVYTGNGITGDVFDPAVAGVGIHEIIYTYLDGNGCANSDTAYTEVRDYDFIAGAIILSDLDNWYSGNAVYTTIGATADQNAASCWNTGPNYNRWFKFQATTNTISIQIRRGESYGTVRRINAAIWEADGTTEVNCSRYISNDDEVYVESVNLTPGNWYYLSVDNNYSNYRGTFSLSIDTRLTYDYKEGAYELQDLNNWCSADAFFSTYGATPDLDAGSCWNTSPNYNRWFKFVATTHKINVEVKTGGALGTIRRINVAIWESDGTTQISCNRYVGNDDNVSVGTDQLVPGNTYYVSVDNNYSGYQGSFTLCIDNQMDYDYLEGAKDITTIINACSNNAEYTTIGATPDRTAPPCWNTSPSYNRWFKFMATTQSINVQLKRGGVFGDLRRAQIALFDKDSTTVLDCNRYVNNDDNVEVAYEGLIPGEWYFVSVDNNYSGYRGTFTLCLDDTPSYDFYEGAIELGILHDWSSSDAAYTTVGATPDKNAASCWNTSPNYNRWFKFTATTSQIHIEIRRGGSYGTIRRVNAAIWEADGETEVACKRYVNNDDIVEVEAINLISGNTYYLSVDNNYSGYRGTFSLYVNDAVDYDYYQGAKDVTYLINSQSTEEEYTTVGATSDKIAGSCWNTSPNYNRWFTFQATTPGINIKVLRGGSYGTIRRVNIALFDADGTTELSCNRYVDNDDIVELDYEGLTPGNWYYFSVDNNYSGYRGTFTLALSDAVSYDYYEGAIELTDIHNWSSPDAAYSTLGATPDKNAASCWNTGPNYNRWFRFTATTPAINVEVRRGGSYGTIRRINAAIWEADGITEVACNRYVNNDDIVSLGANTLTPGNTYYISVDNNYSAYRGTFSLFVDDAMDYDFYEGAHEITDLNNWESQLAEFTTLGATADKNAASCWNTSPDYNRWFKFRAIHSDVSIQALRGGSYGTIRRINLALWESDGTTELSCNRYVSNDDDVSVTYSGLIPGNWYYISIDNNYSAYRGTFTLQVSNVSGNVYYAIADGNWNTASTWSLTEGGPPAVSSPANGDVVYIKGYDVMVSGTETCAELNIETENDQTSLTIDAGTLTVNGKLYFINNGHDVDGSISILNSGNLTVIDDLVMDRSGGSNIFQLLVQDNSTLFVGNDMRILSSAGSTINNKFTVSGTAAVQINQDLILQNTGGIKSIVTLNNSAELQVKREILLTSSVEDKLEIALNNDSRLFPGRTIQRDATPYGILDCNDNSTLVFNSSDYLQVIPENAGAGLDSFSYQNIEVNNTRVSAPQLSLEGHVSVPGTLTLTEGIIQTTAASLLTIENSGTISGGSANSYIQGPLEITGNNAVTFPVGKNGSYQPIAISAPALISDAFIAEYFDVNADPLYDIDLYEASIDHVADCEYWTVQRSSGTSAVNITTSWDGNGCCISDMASLKLAVWDGTEWKDYGNGGTSGTLVSGEITTGNVVDINSFAITFADHLPVVDFTDPGGPYCESAIPVNLTGSPEDANGVFTGDGITDNGNGTAQFNPGTAGNGTHQITYSYTSVSGCSNSLSKNVTVNPGPTSTIIGTDTVCIGTSNEFSIYLTGTAPWDITYSDGTNSYHVITSSNPYKFTTNVPAVYSVIALIDANGCAGSDFGSSAELANWPAPAKPTTSIVSGSTTFCEGNSLVLTTPDAQLYYWNNGVSTQQNTITNPGNYWVSIVNEHGCFSENSDTTTVIVHKTARKPTVISGSTTLCENSPNTTYSTSSLYADSYNWELLPAGSGSIIGAGQSISVDWDDSFAGLAKLSVKGSNVNCGEGPVSDTLYIALDSLPDVVFDAISPVCVNTPPFNLTQGSPGGGIYSGTGITTSPQFNPSIAGIGTHTLTYTFTSGNGCVNYATRDITVNVFPLPDISGPVDICSPGTGIYFTTLNADHSYVWTVSGGTIIAGAGTNQITVEFSAEGAAEIQVTETNDITGCSGTSTLYDVTVHETPITSDIESNNSLTRR
ncbi:MAG: hypothetical protein WD577_13360 [Bacteroidales bacterium]